MNLLKKIGRQVFYSLIIMVFLIIAGTHVMDRVMYYNDEDIGEFLKENNVNGSIEYFPCEDGRMRVVRSSAGSKRNCIIFSHGAPGSWDAFKGFLINERLLDIADLISYDRPGYGNSGCGQSVAGIEFQGKCLTKIIDSFDYDNYYLAGHSYGGPIVMEAAVQDAESIKGVILLAPVVDPDTEKYFPGGKLAYWSWSRWVWPRAFQISADEKYNHAEELKKLKTRLKGYEIPTLFLHSTDDWIAPAGGNIEFIRNHISDSLLISRIYDDKGHLFIWTDQDMVVKLILDFIQGDLKEND